jgi:phosphomannomutase
MKMKKTTTLKISISGARGIIGDSLTPQLTAALAQAFGTYVGAGPVLVGRDARRSGEMLKDAVLAGLLAVGCSPVDVGVLSIPSFLFLTKAEKASGGIAVTASHNPKEWNGLKFISRDGLYLTPHQTEEYLDIYHQGEFAFVPPGRFKPVRVLPNSSEPHLRRVLDRLDAEKIRRRRFRVALDCNNGAGAVLAPRLLEALGCEVIPLNTRPDGEFAHDPEPLPENISEICRAVPEAKADLGFVQDADADRLAIVDEHGTPLGTDATVVLVIGRWLARHAGPVVASVSTSRMVDDVAAGFGCPVYRSRVGEAHVIEAMKLRGAEVGGEGDGGAIVLQVNPCRDSFAAMVLVLEAMAASGRSAGELMAQVPRYAMVRERLLCSARDIAPSLRVIKDLFRGEQFDLTDGVKVRWPDRWLLARPSATEPVIRLAAEAPAESDARALVNRVLEVLSPGA